MSDLQSIDVPMINTTTTPNQLFTNTFANSKFQLQNGNMTLTQDSSWGLSVSSSGVVVMSQDQKQWQQIQFTPVGVAL